MATTEARKIEGKVGEAVRVRLAYGERSVLLAGTIEAVESIVLRQDSGTTYSPLGFTERREPVYGVRVEGCPVTLPCHAEDYDLRHGLPLDARLGRRDRDAHPALTAWLRSVGLLG